VYWGLHVFGLQHEHLESLPSDDEFSPPTEARRRMELECHGQDWARLQPWQGTFTLSTGNFKFVSESVNEVSGSVQVTPGSAALPTGARGPSEAPVASEETQMTSEILRHAQNPAAYRLPVDSVKLNGTSVSRPVPCDDDTVRPL
jgi:hypothetical protein